MKQDLQPFKQRNTMPKFWDLDSFKKLNETWKKRLKESGFKDIEDKNQGIIKKNTRTRTYQDRKIVEEFYVELTHYVTNHPNIPKIERQIIELYCQGIYVLGSNGIIKQTNKTRKQVRRIIEKYKAIIIGK